MVPGISAIKAPKMTYIIVITTNQMIALLRNEVNGSLPNKGYNRMMLRIFIAIIIIIEIVASKKKLLGKYMFHITANTIAAILHRKIHIIKMGINVLGASFLLSDIII
jgi:hypothetical protein